MPSKGFVHQTRVVLEMIKFGLYVSISSIFSYLRSRMVWRVSRMSAIRTISNG
jgi:hypothetical protein